MGGKFIPASETVRERLEWGSLAWCCRPSATGAKDLVAIEVTLSPGGGHAFHKHPEQEEVIYVIHGQVEQWLDREARTLRPGDAIFIPPGTVHASFNTSGQEAKLLAILGPAVGQENGYRVVEVADQAPWNSLR
jgi:quercetin dioxygenase-like cupin family protein